MSRITSFPGLDDLLAFEVKLANVSKVIVNRTHLSMLGHILYS